MVRIEDHLEVYFKGHKTDVEGAGDHFTLIRKGNRFHVHKFVKEYTAKMGIYGRDSLFPVELGNGERGEGESCTAVQHNVFFT